MEGQNGDACAAGYRLTPTVFGAAHRTELGFSWLLRVGALLRHREGGWGMCDLERGRVPDFSFGLMQRVRKP